MEMVAMKLDAMVGAVVLSVLCCSNPLSAAESDPGSPRPGEAIVSAGALRLELDRQAPLWLEKYGVPSVSVTYIENGAIAWTAAYGEQAPGVPATSETLYNVASLAKPVTAETMFRLAAAGRIDLDEPMYSYWIDPDIKDNPWHEKLTPAIALSHQTGFKNWRFNTEGKLRFEWEPGTQVGYSGEGYEYVARYAEKKTGQRLDALAQQYLFDPIGMPSTSHIGRDWFDGRVAIPRGPEGKTREPTIRKTPSAADDLYTTASDYARFLIDAWKPERSKDEIEARRLTIAHENDKSELCPPDKVRPEHCPSSAGIGMGWEVFKYPDATIVLHTGSDWGEQAAAYYIPERRTGAVILTNGAKGNQVWLNVVALLDSHPGFTALTAPFIEP
jgi:CubicO group peptidase (beta-lactamase class C family)